MHGTAGSIYRDDGVSGALDRADRMAFGRLLQDAEKRRFQKVYFYSVDRSGRDEAVIATALKDLRNAGIEYFSLREPQLEDPLYRSLISGMAEAEHKRIRERTHPARLKKFQAGFWVYGEPPFGYRIRPDLTLEQCLPEAGVVRRIFAETLAGRGRTQIAKRLNAELIPPPKVRVKLADGTIRRLRPGYFGGWTGLQEWLEVTGGTLEGATEWVAAPFRKLLVTRWLTANCVALI